MLSTCTFIVLEALTYPSESHCREKLWSLCKGKAQKAAVPRVVSCPKE